MSAPSPATLPPLSARKAALYMVGAVGCFHLAYATPLGVLIFGYVICLTQLARLTAGRIAFYAALLTGLLCIGPQAAFFYGIFGPFAVVLWMILAFWTALYVALAHGIFRRVPGPAAVLLAATVWMGLEYCRSEIYYLRFSWLNVGYALSGWWTPLPFRFFGMYGLGFLAVVLSGACCVWRGSKLVVAALAFAALINVPSLTSTRKGQPLRLAGVQMEFPSTAQLLTNLDALVAQHPEAQLLAVSEYTCTGPVPDEVKAWCRHQRRYLVIGGEDPAPGDKGAYYDTAFVVGPDGEIVFKQGKCRPIQFFSDGLPAPEQKVWDSPWGKLGFCVCYDLSYRRVTDQLVRLGAQALIVPTMDVEMWGRHEHELHERVAPVRAAEYGIPIFRVASSGISQAVNCAGRELATAPFSGASATLSAELDCANGSMPLDASLGPAAVIVTLGCAGWLLADAIRRRWPR